MAVDKSCELAVVDNSSILTFPCRESFDAIGGYLVAERKVTEKYIPKAGDVFAIIEQSFDHGELLCLKSNDGGVAYECLNDEIGHFDSIGVSAKFLFIRKHDDKAANPVNFTSEKYVPRVGEFFAVISKSGLVGSKVFEADINSITSSGIEVLCKTVKGKLLKFRSDKYEFIPISRPSTK